MLLVHERSSRPAVRPAHYATTRISGSRAVCGALRGRRGSRVDIASDLVGREALWFPAWRDALAASNLSPVVRENHRLRSSTSCGIAKAHMRRPPSSSRARLPKGSCLTSQQNRFQSRIFWAAAKHKPSDELARTGGCAHLELSALAIDLRHRS